MQNTTSNLSFSRRIFVLTPKDIGLLSKPENVLHVYAGDGVRGARRVDSKGFTSSILYCLGGLLETNKKSVMAHLYPPDTIKNFSEVRSSVSALPNDENLDIFILGGEYYTNKEKRFKHFGDKSLEVLSKLTDAFKSFKNKSVTIFYGQKTAEDCEVDKATCFLYDKKSKDVFLALDTENPDSFEKHFSPQEIKDYFKIINVSENDDVYVKGRLKDNEVVNAELVPSSFFNSSKEPS